MTNKTIQPYKHDCDRCEWVGWVTFGDRLGNMYVCQVGKMNGRIEIIIRWSDDPPDYACYSFLPDTKPCPITVVGKE